MSPIDRQFVTQQIGILSNATGELAKDIGSSLTETNVNIAALLKVLSDKGMVTVSEWETARAKVSQAVDQDIAKMKEEIEKEQR